MGEEINLWNDAVRKSYSSDDKYQDHILEQYKLYTEMADRISARRNLANTYFLTLNTLLLGTLGFFIKDSTQELKHNYFFLFIFTGLLAFCYAWWRLVKSYSQLNTGKYKVIGEMEKKLPSSPYYSAEWKALGEGKNPKLYMPLTDVEVWVPIIFGLIYLCASIYVTF